MSARAYQHLDSARGVAALIVVLHHAVLSLPESDPLVGWIGGSRTLAILALGRPAVILFFVISGFVLATSLRATAVDATAFAIRRALRLLPPLWTTALLAMVAFELIGGRPAAGMSTWLGTQWVPDVGWGDLARHLAMLPGPRQYPLDHVAWSLTHELRLSLAMPFLVVALVRFGAWPCIAAAMLASVGADLAMATWPQPFPHGYHGYVFDASGSASLVVTLHFAAAFVVGAAIALNVAAVRAPLPRRPASIVAGAIGLIALSQEAEWSMLLGASLVVVALAMPRAASQDRLRPLAWLGRVSFSLYLVHVPIMQIVARCCAGSLSPREVVILAIILSLIGSEAAYRFVEEPSLWLARRASRAFPTPPAARDAEIARSNGYRGTPGFRRRANSEIV